MTIETVVQAKDALIMAWPSIEEECLAVLGSELHYQAMVYHCLRSQGLVPAAQLGMNVKMWIKDPVSELFKKLDARKHKNFQGGFEPIPDVVIFKPKINSDWRRRNMEHTLTEMLIAIEVKASERSGSRLQPKEIRTDIEKLAAHREEVQFRGSDMLPVMMIIDSAPLKSERMTASAVESFVKKAEEVAVGVLYCSPDREINTLKGYASCSKVG